MTRGLRESTMDKTILNLETVTPMFLRGHDNKTPELRPPPFKALFRYWWRAVVGEDENNLRNKERDLFGNTKKRSPLSVRISGQASLRFDEYAPLPHQPDRFKSQAYHPNETFNLTLVAPLLSEYERIAEIGFLLGGVGNRSRRGFGSIRYQDWSFHTVADLQDKVFQTLHGISPGRFHKNPGSKIQVAPTIRLPDYPVIQAIYLGDTSEDVNNLLRRIGQATHYHCDNALGSANPRMASPIHVRIQKVGNGFVPIVTQLNSVFPGTPPLHYGRKQKDFIDAIIA